MNIVGQSRSCCCSCVKEESSTVYLRFWRLDQASTIHPTIFLEESKVLIGIFVSAKHWSEMKPGDSAHVLPNLTC